MDSEGVWAPVDENIASCYATVQEAVGAYQNVVYDGGADERPTCKDLARLYEVHLADAVQAYEETHAAVMDGDRDVHDVMALLENNRLLRKTVQDSFLERVVMSYLGEIEDASTLLNDVDLQEGSFITPPDLPDIYREIVSKSDADDHLDTTPVTVYDRLNTEQDELIALLQEYASTDVASEKAVFRAAPIYDGYILPDIDIGRDDWTPRPRTESPLRTVHEGLERLDPDPEDTIYDLGSGYGYFVLYGALTTDATYHGVEIDSEILGAADGMRDRFGLDNATFHNTDVREYDDLSRGDVFYLFNPFPQDVLAQVSDQLANVAEEKPITVISLGMSSWHFNEQEWLAPATTADAEAPMKETRLKIFESV